MKKLKKLQTLEQVHEYIQNGNKAPAVFLPFSVDFSIMKHVRNTAELSNVSYFWDLVLGTSQVDPTRIYLDYGTGTPFQDDIQIYNNNIIKESETVGQIFANEAGLISLTYDNIAHIYDPRGFKVAEIVNDERGEIIHIYKGERCAYILTGLHIFDTSTGQVSELSAFQEVFLYGF